MSSFHTFAAGVSPYLPIGKDPLLDLELHRLATVAKMPILSRPYHAATVYKYLDKVVDSHPQLHQRIKRYLRRYMKDKAITHASVEISASNNTEVTLPNQRGQMLDDNYKLDFNSFWQVNSHLIVNAGGVHYEDGGFIPNNNFVSFGWDVFQVDVGYREHWLSPFQEGAVLLSTQAKAPLNVTISNPTLITDWNIKYEMSVGILEEHDDIQFDREEDPVSGKPGFLSMHASIQPFDWWTIAGNRTFMFAGDGSGITIGDIWQAIIDPVNADNCGGEGTELQDCSEEFGNQQASITNRFDLSWNGTPFSLYYEYAGEDTNNYSNYRLANLANSFGLFLPYLNDTMSLNMEFTSFQSAWYTHHIYGEGYSNDGVKMGHWWGAMKAPKDSLGGEAGSVRLDWQNSSDSQVSFLYRTASFNNDNYNYEQAHELEVKYSKAVDDAFVEVNLYLGKNAYGDNFVQTSVAYLW
ncbi:capsule assembly Wzi family protein [Thalassotalea sp. PLHSN55]|uniref:capsule assembly Wzi family protein n=1 Tax=Thalassotalea sp. PLHSN55 TaxID=3435888 RepID=UPI003F86494A